MFRPMTLLACAALLLAGPAAAQKVIVYTSNDFELEPLRLRGIRRRKPASRWRASRRAPACVSLGFSPSESARSATSSGASRTLLRANKALLAPYASKNKDTAPVQLLAMLDHHWIGSNVHILVILQTPS